MRVKKVLKRELASNRKYKTTYKDIKKYFRILNNVIFENKLSPFGQIQIKNLDLIFMVIQSKKQTQP